MVSLVLVWLGAAVGKLMRAIRLDLAVPHQKGNFFPEGNFYSAIHFRILLKFFPSVAKKLTVRNC